MRNPEQQKIFHLLVFLLFFSNFNLMLRRNENEKSLQARGLCKNLGICQIPTLIFDKQEKQKKAQARLDIFALSTRMIICIFMCF